MGYLLTFASQNKVIYARIAWSGIVVMSLDDELLLIRLVDYK